MILFSVALAALLTAPTVFAGPPAVASLHDGPNCFNAALVGAGYTESIRYVDGAEYRYYLETFCSRRKGKEQAGDLAVFDDGAAAHAALILGGGKIFEKTSGSGSRTHAPLGSEVPGAYLVKDKSASPFYSGERGPFDIQVYRCADAKTVRAYIARNNREAAIVQILNLQMRLDAKLRADMIPSLEDLNADVVSLTNTIASRSGRGEADLYTLVLATSLWGALQATMLETSTVFVTDLYDHSRLLHGELKKLATRIASRTNDPRALRVLREFNAVP